MQKFTQHHGIVAPLMQANIDTDQIIPKQYLKSIKKTGFGIYLFDDWRYLTPGDLSMEQHSRKKNPDFILNQEPYQQASILLSGENFGCGSSREHAPWALLDFGFRVVIAPSFADIFYNNSFKNGLLLIQLGKPEIEHLNQIVTEHKGYTLHIDLEQEQINLADGTSIPFNNVEPFRRYALLHGLDEIGITLESAADIKAYERKQMQKTPWLFPDMMASS